jgi:hypothetical protein
MKIIRENINFERGQDPKKSMGIGQAKEKEQLLSMLDDPMSYPANENVRGRFKYRIKVIDDPITKVTFDTELRQL